MIKKLRNLLAITSGSLFACSAASAQTDGTWEQPDGGTYNWSDAGNWTGGTVAGGTDATASFTVDASGAQTVDLDTAVTLGNLTLNRNQNLTIAGPEALTLDVTSGIPTLDVNSGRTLNINTELAGTDGLQLQGGGRLNVNATPTLTGGLTLIGSTLGLNQSGSFDPAINALADGPLSLSEGAELLLRGGNDSSSQVEIGTGGGTMQNRGNNVYQTTGNLTGTGTLTYGNAGGSGGRRLEFNSTANDFTGGFVFTRDDQRIQVNSLGGGNDITFNNGGIFIYHSGAEADLTLGTVALNAGTGQIVNDSDHAITINSDLIATGGGAKTLELSAAAGPTNVFAGVIADETDGGEGTVALNVVGGGTWELQGANTYTGNTTVDTGATLIFAQASQAFFAIGDNGINNAILGSGTANFDGTFVFDLTGASSILGDVWNVVDVDSLGESYGITFSVASTQGSFSDDGGVWSIFENGQTYQFSQDTGNLTVVPEPSTVLLLGLVGVGLVLRRRRR